MARFTRRIGFGPWISAAPVLLLAFLGSLASLAEAGAGHCPPVCSPPPHLPPCYPNCPPLSDILLTGGAGWSSLPVARSKGDGSWVVTNSYVGDFGSWAATPGAVKLAGDFNGDGRTDVALIGAPGWTSVPMALSNGDGTFQVRNSYVGVFGAWASSSGVVALTGDFNGDGRTDIALTGNPGWASVPVALSMGNGNFIFYNNPAPDFAAWSATPGVVRLTGDFNGDGNTDIALTGPPAVTGAPGWGSLPLLSGSLAVALSDSFGGFLVTNYASPDLFDFAWTEAPDTPVFVGDFDGDGRDDIALTGHLIGRGFGTIPVAYSDCSQFDCSFKPFYFDDSNFAAEAAREPTLRSAGDFNGDGLTDLLLAWPFDGPQHPSQHSSYESGALLALSRGDRTFEVTGGTDDRCGLWESVQYAGVIQGDFNGDGAVDFGLVNAYFAEIAFCVVDGNGKLWGFTLGDYYDFPVWAERPEVTRLGGHFAN